MKTKKELSSQKNAKIQNKGRALPSSLDEIDLKILDVLQEDNQITNQDLAQRVGLSPPPCLRRVRSLRQSGVITKDVALVDPAKVGKNLIIFINVSLEKQREDMLAHFERKMREQPEVLQCYFLSGETDYLLIIHSTDMEDYNGFVRKVLANEPNIRNFRSHFCLSRVKYTTKTPLSS
jgi:Lrp/AsnC family leucine-responsive transcriptional regulator